MILTADVSVAACMSEDPHSKSIVLHHTIDFKSMEIK